MPRRLPAVEDETFWEGLEPVIFGSLPRLQDSVTVIGWVGGWAGGRALAVCQNVCSSGAGRPLGISALGHPILLFFFLELEVQPVVLPMLLLYRHCPALLCPWQVPHWRRHHERCCRHGQLYRTATHVAPVLPCFAPGRYPIGGDTMSVTSGVVSRIEVTGYAHGAAELGPELGERPRVDAGPEQPAQA